MADLLASLEAQAAALIASPTTTSPDTNRNLGVRFHPYARITSGTSQITPAVESPAVILERIGQDLRDDAQFAELIADDLALGPKVTDELVTFSQHSISRMMISHHAMALSQAIVLSENLADLYCHGEDFKNNIVSNIKIIMMSPDICFYRKIVGTALLNIIKRDRRSWGVPAAIYDSESSERLFEAKVRKALTDFRVHLKSRLKAAAESKQSTIELVTSCAQNSRFNAMPGTYIRWSWNRLIHDKYRELSNTEETKPKEGFWLYLDSNLAALRATYGDSTPGASVDGLATFLNVVYQNDIRAYPLGRSTSARSKTVPVWQKSMDKVVTQLNAVCFESAQDNANPDVELEANGHTPPDVDADTNDSEMA